MTDKRELYFDEIRLKTSSTGRFLIRLVSFAAYALVIAGAIFLTLSEVSYLRSGGILLVLFLIDRVFHLGKAPKTIARAPKSGRINVTSYLLLPAYFVFEYALEKTQFLGGDIFLYVAQKLIERKETKEGLSRMGVDIKTFEEKLDEYLKQSLAKKNAKKELLKQVEVLAVTAFEHAEKARSAYIEPKDVFSALYHMGDENLNKLFKIFEIDENDLENALIFSRYKQKLSGLKRLPSSLTGFLGRPYKVRHRVMNRAWTARPTPTLDSFSTDLTDLARMETIGFLVGHENEYDQLIDILSKPRKPNALVVGEPYSGKSSLIAHLAYEIIKDRVPPSLFDKRIVALDISRLISGAGEGEIAARIQTLVNEIISAGNIILYIPDIHNLLKTMGAGKMTMADMLLPTIKSESVSVIGGSFPREYKQYIEPNNDFASAFSVVKVAEIDEPTAERYMVFASIPLEIQYKIVISFGAIKQSVILAHKYFRQKLLPSSAKDLLEEALADAVSKKKKILAPDDVISVAQRKINIPLVAAKEVEAQKLLNLEQVIHERLVDQEKAVEAVSRALREYRSGLSRKGGPIATFLFVGPTGVGKTELSKILTKIQFGSSEMMVRLDMSEYQEKQSIFRLIGTPDGSTGGTLTDAIREKPYSLILLDEFEKAHPDILNVFLQVFDDGRLTDNLGRMVDFQNTIIISTSNAHSTYIKEEIEKGTEMKAIAEGLKKKLTDYFRPELINRFSNIVVFKNLSPDDTLKITEILLKDLSGSLSEEQGIDIAFDESTIKKIAELGYDPVFGARPLRNVISEKIRGVLAEKILKGEIVKGSSVKVIFKDNKFLFNV